MTYVVLRGNSSRIFSPTFLLYAEFISIELCESWRVVVASFLPQCSNQSAHVLQLSRRRERGMRGDDTCGPVDGVWLRSETGLNIP
jgi:hypothetical protein